ncbi:hypothetical protein CRUP_033173 [Coryphaenoides rupestris]|nr:hypothetical protein CRUP_033173 [Coryphaenoides rupestris]
MKTSKERAWSRDRRIHTYPECSGGLQPTTLNDTAATGPSPSYSVLDDDGLICRHPVVFPDWKAMKSHDRPLYQRPQFQSPAKVFAKLKAKVLRDAGGTQTQHGGEVVSRSRENGASVFLTPRKGKENAEALTISPLRARCVYPPMKTPEDPSSLRNPMSPAKVFSQMKKRTSKRQQEAGDVRNGFAAVKPQPVLVEDPLVIHSPQLFSPKKHKAVFKQNPAASENRPKSKQGSGYELTQWTIKFNREGLYLDGVRTSDNILWHSTVIAERISRLVLKTVSGSTYTLIGKMNNDVVSKLPKWLLSKFTCGFPVRWKMHLEKFRSQPKTAASSTGAESQTRCPSSAKPIIKYPNPKSEKTPMSTPSPPLEFWKGGRVIVDASMNVTIHEAYETTVCMAPPNTPGTILESPPPKQHDGVFRQAPQRSEFPGRPAAHHQPPGPQRKVKATSRGGRAKGRKPASDPIQPPEKGQPRGRVIPEDQEAHTPPSTASQPQRLLREAAPRTTHAPRRQDPPDPHYYDGPAGGRGILETALPRKRNYPASKEPPVAHSSTPPSDEDVPVRRKIKRKGTPRNVIAESQSSDSSSKSLNSSDGWGAVPRKGKGKRGGSRPNTTQGQLKTRSKKSVGGADCASKTASPRKQILPASKQPPVAHSSASPPPVRRKVQRKGTPRNVIPESQSSASQSKGSSDGCGAWPRKGKGKGGSRTPKPAPAPVSVLGLVGAQARKRGGQSTASKTVDTQEEEEEKWTEAELMRLKEAVASFPKHMGGYWVNVAFMVRTRSPEECQMQQMLQGSGGEAFSKTDVAPKKKKITAAVGTLKRKQQVRQFMEAMPKDDHDDAFSSAAMQTRRFQGFSLSNLEPLTPRGCGYPAAKTPPCLHITPGMMGSVNRKNDDKYVYRLQKRMKRRQINACKVSPPMKTFPLTSSEKPNMRKCGNMDDDSFVVREMFPNNNGAHDESGEEEDFYFSDSF